MTHYLFMNKYAAVAIIHIPQVVLVCCGACSPAEPLWHYMTSIWQIGHEICPIYQSGLNAARFIYRKAAFFTEPEGTGASNQASKRVLTSVLLEQLVGVLDDFVILLQLQHALAVVQLQRDDHSTQINVVYIARHLLHVCAQMEEEEEEGAMSCCAAWQLLRALQSFMWLLWVLIYKRKHNTTSGKHH